ncbi:hypothetical protein HK104_003207 [Borealophlyctis nickersoniae]|nr:hypothetical protein HK104_003207 [Borealophlyctis nickersoniae]
MRCEVHAQQEDGQGGIRERKTGTNKHGRQGTEPEDEQNVGQQEPASSPPPSPPTQADLLQRVADLEAIVAEEKRQRRLAERLYEIYKKAARSTTNAPKRTREQEAGDGCEDARSLKKQRDRYRDQINVRALIEERAKTYTEHRYPKLRNATGRLRKTLEEDEVLRARLRLTIQRAYGYNDGDTRINDTLNAITKPKKETKTNTATYQHHCTSGSVHLCWTPLSLAARKTGCSPSRLRIWS